jgi:hypothetical protein
LPDINAVALDCWHSGSEPVESEQIRTRDYPHDAEEERFLVEKDAVRFRPEVLQLTALVRHPQPARGYTLRWPLTVVACAEPSTLREWNLWRGLLLQRKWPANEEGLQELEQELRSILKADDTKMAVYAYDSAPQQTGGAPRMKLVYPAALLSARISVPVGRGVFGRALRSRAPFHFFNREGKMNPAEPIDGFPDDVGEILALPLVHPLVPSGDPQDSMEQLQHSKVSCVIVLYRTEVRDDEQKLDPARWPDENGLVQLLYQRIIERLLQASPTH